VRFDLPSYPYLPFKQGISTYALKMPGNYFDETCNDIKQISLEDLFDPEHPSADLFNTRTICFIGESGAGKGVLTHALARMVSVGQNKSAYYWTKALDPIGLQCRAGQMDTYGAVVLDDVKLESCKDQPLEFEEIRNMLDVQDGGSYKSRYHTAELPKGQPRFLLQNNYVDPGTNIRMTWFAKNNMPAADAVQRNDLRALRAVTCSTQRGIARRVIIFDVKKHLMTKTYHDELRRKRAAASAAILRNVQVEPQRAADEEFPEDSLLTEA
jgi:ABC-type dipeptide/oligopeptide/nickel transport system ATPase component